VIPVYNMGAYISQTLDSLVKQTLKEIEIIVVDDGSTDHLIDLINYYSKKDNRIIYRSFANRGGAARARNYGNREAMAPIICVCDAGDVYTKWRAEITEKYFRRHKRVGVLCCAVAYNSEEWVDPVMPRLYKGKQGEKLMFEHPGTAYKQELAVKYPYREDNIDTDQYDAFFFTLGKNGVKFGVSDKIVCWKTTLWGYKYGRDLNKSRLSRIKLYREFGIKIPEWLKEFEKNYKGVEK